MSRKKKPASELLDGKHDRAGLILVRRAIRNGWKIPEELYDQLPRVVTALVANARTDRERIRAIEVLISMQRDNIAALAAADRVERLEQNTPTEIITLAPITLRPGGGPIA